MKTLKIILSKEEISSRVQQLGQEISQSQDGRPLVIISVLKGAFMFTADLVRAIDVPTELHFMRVKSYEGSQSTCVVKEVYMPELDVEGKDVLVVEDIIDTGYTIHHICEKMSQKNPRSLEVCSLLSKPSNHSKRALEAKYIGFTLPNKFVVGYGLDFDEKYRDLPDLCELT